MVDSDDFVIRELAPNGSLRRLMTKPHAHAGVSNEDWDRYVEARVEGLTSRTGSTDELRIRAREELNALEHADRLPAISHAFVSQDGLLWVKEYELSGVMIRPWHIFGPDGRWLTSLEVPVGIRVLDAGDDWVVVTSKGDLDEEIVMLLPLSRGLSPQ